jgi:NADH-quinone oxidoreductase subunit J
VTATFESGPIGDLGNTQALGFELFSTYLLPFEAISIVLLLAVVGAVVLAKRQLR